MDLDSVTDIAVLKNYLKRYMRRMKQTVEFNLGAYKKRILLFCEVHRRWSFLCI